MPFPAIGEAISRWLAPKPPLELGLKSTEVGFDPVSVAWYARNGYPGLFALLGGGGPSWSGETVSDASSLTHSVVWCCRRIISESVAFMPLSLMQKTSRGKFPAEKHPMYNALHYEPNPEMSDMEFRETRTDHVVAGGNGYAQIIRRSGTGVATELWPLDPSQVRADRLKTTKALVYVVKDGNAQEKTYTVVSNKPQDILHIRGLGSDGITGHSVIQMARQSIGTAQSAEKYAAKFYAAGGRVPYLLERSLPWKNDTEGERFAEEWKKHYANADSFHAAPILPPGLKYTQIGLKPEDSQFLESRQFEIPEICRWFLISPHMVGDLSRATFSNIEHLALQFVKMTLTAWIVRWEKALWRCVLTPEEKAGGYFFRHNVNGLLRGDFLSRMQGYATALQNGWMSQNEVRDLEDMNGFDGGDDYHVQLNMQTLPGGTPTTSERAQLAKIGSASRNGGSNG